LNPEMMANPKILYITSCWPHDRAFGGQLRTLHIGRALQKLGKVTIAVVSSDVAPQQVMEKTAAEFTVKPPIRVESQGNRGLMQRLRWAFDPHFLNVHGCVADSADRQRLLNDLDGFDLIWLQNSRTANILNRWRWPHSVLDVDDIPSTYQRTIWRDGSGVKKKIKAGVTMGLLRRRENAWKERFDALAVCSDADRSYLGNEKNIYVIPNGFERPTNEPLRHPMDPPRLGFIGLYSYLPNLEGVRWFIRDCWPLVKREVPNARLRLIGKDTDGPLKLNCPDIDGLGFVEDPASEIATWSAMVVPVLHGGGTRVKIADAFSRKCPVVSTPLGAFGYRVESGRELLIAGTSSDFAAACISLIRNRERGKQMAEEAYKAFLQNWTWDSIAPSVRAAAEEALRSKGSAAVMSKSL
jgi:glycosyltransferase involved in cell wall biosynthesis